jgi:pimeloyl-ACP methyl ester carboxylesterase
MSWRAGFRYVSIAMLVLVTAAAAIRGAAWWRERDETVPASVRLVTTSRGRIAVDVRGQMQGVPVLIVPGTAGWSGFWREVSAHLARQGFRVIAVDLPPFGYSDRDPLGRYDRRRQAARLAAVLDRLAGRPAIVVAHSFGAGPAVELALNQPKRVARLVLVDAAIGQVDPPPQGGIPILEQPIVAQPLVAATLTNPHLIGLLSRSMLARKDAAAAWKETLRVPMRRPGTTTAYAAWLPSLFVADDGAVSRRSAGLRTMRPPVRLIWGEDDTVTPIEQGERLSLLLRAPLRRLPGVGHVPHIEDRDGFLSALDEAVATDDHRNG